MLLILEQLMDWIARYTLVLVFTLMFTVGLIIKAMYNFNDSPYFELITIYDIVATIIFTGIVVVLYIYRELIQTKINYKICCVYFLCLIILFIWQVPLTPFSDMRAVYEGAINFAKLDWIGMLKDEYWDVFPGNIRLSVFWGILLILFPKNLVTLKLFNAIILYVIIALTRCLAREYGVKYYNIVYVFMLTFSPFYLYINSVYYDMPLIMFCLLGLYIYKKYKNILMSMVFIGFACFLRKSGQIFMIAIVIMYMFDNKNIWKSKEWIKKILILGCSIVLCNTICRGCINIINNTFLDDNYKSYSSWNMYYMGLNEAEFGFQDNVFSYDIGPDDVVDRIIEYGPERLTKILVKKTFWLWTQGTYQAQRYGFGPDQENVLDKFEYETFMTKYLMHDGQMTRKVINAFMRAQYYAMFGLMILTMYKKKNTERFRMFYYIIIATFLAMLIYELKSRYIIHLAPLMIILAGDYFESLDIKRQSNKLMRVK